MYACTEYSEVIHVQIHISSPTSDIHVLVISEECSL